MLRGQVPGRFFPSPVQRQLTMKRDFQLLVNKHHPFSLIISICAVYRFCALNVIDDDSHWQLIGFFY